MIAGLWVAFVVLASLDLWTKADPRPGLERVVKPGAMVVLIAIAALSGAADSVVGQWFLAALALCLLGDVLLLTDGDRRFLAGLTAFLLGHVAYAVAFVLVGLPRPWWGLLLLAVLGGVLPVAKRIVTGATHSGGPGMGGAVAAYIAVISTMAILGAMTGHLWLGVGAVAFVVSDTVLGFDRFVRTLDWGGVAVMATYLLAQALLVIGLVALLPS